MRTHLVDAYIRKHKLNLESAIYWFNKALMFPKESRHHEIMMQSSWDDLFRAAENGEI